MKKIITLLLLMLLSGVFFAQSHYWVFFSDKKGVKFNPYEYFSQKAIQRRIRNHLSLYDSTDYPVKKSYINIVKKIAEVNVVSRWFNCVSVIADDEQIEQISRLNFVKQIQRIRLSSIVAEYDTSIKIYDKFFLDLEMKTMQASKFAKNDITGKGIRIAIFDAGFPNVDNNPVFAYLFKHHQIIKTYDFAKKRKFVYDYDEHGSMTLSCIAGRINGHYLGLAPDAEFLLARTEVNGEPFSEEENWLAAAQWADKNGADIISCSLGYSESRYFQYQMNGSSSLVAKAAKMASDKGILVVNSMGNDGDDFWSVMDTPADVPEVLSVGAIDPYTLRPFSFSSLGPNANGVIKPELSAPGHAMVAGKYKIKDGFGTSFSCPLVAGFAACVLQLDPFLTEKKLKQKLIQSASLYPYYDYDDGYGIPQASFFTDSSSRIHKKTFSIDSISASKIFVSIKKVNFATQDSDYFYYHFRSMENRILEYFIITTDTNHLQINIENLVRPFIFMAHYKYYTKELIVK